MRKRLSLCLAFAMALGLLSASAGAAGLTKTISAALGTELWVIVETPNGQPLRGHTLLRGELPPGLGLERDSRGLLLSGVPEEFGAWTAELELSTAGENYILTLEVFIREESPTPEPSPSPEPSATPSPTPAPTRAPTPIPEPVINKDPTGETVEAGDSVMFIARADNVIELVWELLDPQGNHVCQVQNAAERFPGLWAEGQGTEVLTMGPIPRELDGWQVVCRFVGLDHATVLSAPAVISVSDAPTEGDEASSGEHVHDFSAAWHWNESSHWRECGCGLRDSEGYHAFVWTETRRATARQEGEQTGVCGVCGYTIFRPLPIDSDLGRTGLVRTLLLILLALVALLLLLGAVLLLRRTPQRQRQESRGYTGRYDQTPGRHRRR